MSALAYIWRHRNSKRKDRLGYEIFVQADVASALLGIRALPRDFVSSTQLLGDVLFCSAKAALMELYLPFVRGHEGAMHALRSVMSRGDVARAVDSIASSDERVSRTSLRVCIAA